MVEGRTTIYRLRSGRQDAVGYLCGLEIYRLRWESGHRIGRVALDGEGWRVLRDTRFDEKELGWISDQGEIYSHGLFEGGALGWLEEDGAVVQGGLIFAEQEVGRVEGPQTGPAAAALLLIFLPEEEESDREILRRG